MRRWILLAFLSVFLKMGYSQRTEIDLQLGTMGYGGDLTQTTPVFRALSGGVGINFRYKLSDYAFIRAGFLFGQVAGNDKFNRDEFLQRRNLSFKSLVAEASLGMEFNLISPEDANAYPYLFVMAGYFHYNPYAFDKSGEKVYLKPLSTEGQGLPEYPDRREYELNQFCIPFGVGVKKDFSSRVVGAFELGFRKTFTDYLDDVSRSYVDYNILQSRKGQKAVEMAFREKTAAGVPAEPVTGNKRGNPERNDWYYFIGLRLTLRLGSTGSIAANGY